MIQDTEQISLEEEEGVAPTEEAEEEKGSGQGVEPGSATAIFDEFIGRYTHISLRGHT